MKCSAAIGVFTFGAIPRYCCFFDTRAFHAG